MICIIKHKKSSKFVQAAFGKIDVFTRAINKSSVKLHLNSSMQKARLIEDPSFENVAKWGCEVIPVMTKTNKIEQAYRIIESDTLNL